MALLEEIKTQAINSITNIDLDRLNLYARENNSTLNDLYQTKILDDTSIESSLEQAVLTCGRRDYQYLTNVKNPHARRYPDHLNYSEFLVYTIEQGIFTKHELSQIKFDHGDTIETFTRSYRKENLLELLRTPLLNPQQVSYLGDVSHCCC